MADQKISQLPTITGANMADNDKFVLVDTSGDATVATTREEFFKSVPNVTFGDNDKAIFGAGSDLEISSNGASAIIRAGNASSDIRLESDNRIVICDRAFNETFAVFNDDDDVKLYHNNLPKLATTSTGVDVTGTATMDGLSVAGQGTITKAVDDQLTLAYNAYNSTSYGYYSIVNNNVGNEFSIHTGGSKSLNLAANGDISFYEATGTTPKMVWKSADENLTLGSPSGESGVFTVHKDITFPNATNSNSDAWNNTNKSHIKLESGNNALGIGVENTSNTRKAWLQAGHESAAFASSVYDSELLLQPFGGNVGIGTSSPSGKLTLKAGDNTYAGGFRLEGTDETTALGITHVNGDNFFSGNATDDHLVLTGSGNVGIGTSSPNASFKTTLSGLFGLRIQSADTNNSALNIGCDTSSGVSFIDSTKTGTGTFLPLRFATSDAERMRIDSSGNVLVGKTSTSSALTTAGVDLRPEGRSFMTRSAGPALYLSRTTSDGNIAEFYKDGSTVGSIGVLNSRLQITSEDEIQLGVYGTPRVRIFSSLMRPETDNQYDLGISSTRFKDLYLSGGLRADTLKFSTLAGSELMRIDSSGNVGIGEANPTEKLEVDGTVKATSFEGDGSNLTGIPTPALEIIAYARVSNATTNPLTVDFSTGFSSMARTSTGNYTFTFSSARSSVDYMVFCQCASGSLSRTQSVNTQSTTAFNVDTRVISSGGSTDQDFNVIVYALPS